MKKPTLAAVCASLLVLGGAAEAAKISGSSSVWVKSDYRFRGISFTSNSAALQGEITFSHPSGAYIGTWASSIAGLPNGATELDWYVGYANSFRGLNYNLMYFSYHFPGNSQFDYPEFWGNLNYDLGFTEAGGFGPVNAKFAARQTLFEDFNGDGNGFGTGTVFEGHLTVPLPQGFTLAGRFGHQHYENAGDYNYWDVGLSRSFFGLNWQISYVDTNVDDTGHVWSGQISEADVLFSVSHSANWDAFNY